MSRLEENQQIEKARIGYQTAVGLVGLVSQEIYSRFNAMLTANSIIIAIIGWTLTREQNLPMPLTILLPVVGLILCSLWFRFVKHGVYWQNLFREKAKRLENQYFSDTFKLISLVATEAPQPSNKVNSQIPKWVWKYSFYRTSRSVIFVFAFVYIVIVIIVLYQLISDGI